MQKKWLYLLIAISSVVILLGLVIITWGLSITRNRLVATVNEAEAIATIQKQYPQLKDYPNNLLPPKSIQTEATDGGLYIAFIQEGSGIPVIDAHCFFYTIDKSITPISYIQQDSSVFGSFSPIECKIINTATNSDCTLNTCHGLDIICGTGSSEDLICTTQYLVGDKCLQYAKCGIQNGSCQQIPNAQFNQCKSCIQDCININKNDSEKLFACEASCN